MKAPAKQVLYSYQFFLQEQNHHHHHDEMKMMVMMMRRDIHVFLFLYLIFFLTKNILKFTHNLKL